MNGAGWRFTLLGYQLGLARPAFLLLLGLSVLLLALAVVLAARRKSRLSRVFSARLADRIAPGVSVGRPLAQGVLYGLGLLLFAFALAQPQCGSHSELAKRRGIDVVVALDASNSMLARDVQPSRLERAKLELTTLLDQLKGDRVGIVAFAGDAFIQCPLTSDYGAAKMFLRAIEPDAMPQGGTNIGAALLLSKQVLENAGGAKDKVVVLISDGEDLTGEVSEGVEALGDAGVKVLAVGIGSEQGEPIPLLNKRGEMVGYKKDASGTTVLTRLDRAGLTAIAEATGGELFHEPRSVAMGQVVAIIDRMQKSELESRLTVRYAEGYQPFLAVGLSLLAAGMLVRTSRRRPA
ncbi:MAG: VWA domain-containing protein [Myxococcales bacterium]|nr:VWA domain-containing protein [Myxococcales bacterium]